jgi:hypothetical protein
MPVGDEIDRLLDQLQRSFEGYHAGQIALLRRALQTRQDDPAT